MNTGKRETLCKHVWQRVMMTRDGMLYTCLKCKATKKVKENESKTETGSRKEKKTN